MCLVTELFALLCGRTCQASTAYYGKYATLMKLYKVQIWTMVHGLRTSRPGLTPQ